MFTFFGSVQKNNNNTSTNTNNKNNNLTMSVKTFDKKLYFLLNLWILQHLNDPCETCETFFLLLIRQSCSGLSSLHHWDGSERLSRKISYQVVLEVLWVLVHPHLEIPYHPSLLVVLETHNRNKYCLNFYILCHSIQIHCNMEKVRKFDLSCTFLTFYLFFAVRLNHRLQFKIILYLFYTGPCGSPSVHTDLNGNRVLLFC